MIKDRLKIIISTIVVAVMFIIFKLFSFGWLTILFGFFIHFTMLILYIATGVRIAEIKEKTSKDYLRWFLMSGSLLLHSIVFVDFGDTEESAKLLQNVPDKILSLLTNITFVLSVVLIIVYFIVYKKKVNKEIKKELQTRGFYSGLDGREIVGVILGIASLIIFNFIDIFCLAFSILGLLLTMLCKNKLNFIKAVAIILNSTGIILGLLSIIV